MDNYHFDDFTEDHYRQLLRTAGSSYRFISYRDYKLNGKNILWRHDVDMSLHRALRLAEIEAENGLQATYFILLHSNFYNPLEKDAAGLIRKIMDMGHELALHFDPNFYNFSTRDLKAFESALCFEKNILETIFKTTIETFSFHDPEAGGWLDFTQDVFAGMINTYGAYFKENFSYCSDSNGYWRFRRLMDVLTTVSEEKLQILTHPVWWTPEVLTPRARISRAIQGRAQYQHRSYDCTLAAYERKNVGTK